MFHVFACIHPENNVIYCFFVRFFSRSLATIFFQSILGAGPKKHVFLFPSFLSWICLMTDQISCETHRFRTRSNKTNQPTEHFNIRMTLYQLKFNLNIKICFVKLYLICCSLIFLVFTMVFSCYFSPVVWSFERCPWRRTGLVVPHSPRPGGLAAHAGGGSWGAVEVQPIGFNMF